MSTPAPAAALQNRVHKLLNSRAELEATKALLRTIVSNESSPATSIVKMDASGASTLATLRRSLRSSLEHQQLALAELALDNLNATIERISKLASEVDALDMKCDQVHKYLETTKRDTEQVQTEAATLATERDKAQQECKEARNFLNRYQLTDEEVRTLYAEQIADEDVEDYFSTLERVKQIKADCKELFATGEVNCGLELLDTLGKYQEAGFKRLYQWTAKKCTEVDGDTCNSLHRAIALLSDHTEFYNYCKECLTASRRSQIVQRFLLALTVGGPNGIPRPIEMHAHDPVRYCGDMLAWVHQAIATESEFFCVLFGGDVDLCPPTASTNEALDGNPGLLAARNGNSTRKVDNIVCTSMVGCAFDGVAKMLQVRVKQTISSSHGIVIAYKLKHLLAFYHRKLDKLITYSEVAQVLCYCREAANEAFNCQFEQLMDSFAASAQDYAASLAATHSSLDVSHRLLTLLDVFQTSLVPEEDKEAELAPLFDSCVQALELMCQRSVASLENVDALVFRINNFSCFQDPLGRIPEVSKWHLNICSDLDRWLQELSEVHAKHVLDRCRATALLDHIQEFQQNHACAMELSPADTPGLDGETITQVMDDFFAALMTLVFPQLDNFAQSQNSDKFRMLISATLARKYAFIYEFVFDVKNGYKPIHEPSSSSGSSHERSRHVVLRHAPDDVRTVLELDVEVKA